MQEESHTQDTVHVITNELTHEQEDILWWEHYERIIRSIQEEKNGSL